MKSLKFNHEAAGRIRLGVKNVTWRFYEDKQIAVNDQLMLIDKVDPRDPSTWQAFGTAKVDTIVEKRLEDITDDDVKQEGHANRAQLFETYRSYYGPMVDGTTPVSIIYFTFEPLHTEPHGPTNTNLELDGTTLKALSGTVQTGPLKLPKEVKLYADGGSRGNPGPSAGGFAIMSMDDQILLESGKYLGLTTNNQAEYHSVKGGLEAALKGGAREVYVYMDSLLVVNQMKGIYKVKNRDLWPIYEAIKVLVKQFKAVEFQHVPRELNKLADSIVNKTLDEIADK